MVRDLAGQTLACSHCQALLIVTRYPAAAACQKCAVHSVRCKTIHLCLVNIWQFLDLAHYEASFVHMPASNHLFAVTMFTIFYEVLASVILSNMLTDVAVLRPASDPTLL